jgi:hypothetical protein
MAINVAVEIFVIKTLSVLNLVIILVAQRWHQGPTRCLQELAQSLIVSRVKGIVALLTIAGSLTIAACSFFEPGESVQEESGRARYRAVEENPLNAPDVTSLREKVPGETR